MSQNIVIALCLYAVGAILYYVYGLATYKEHSGESPMESVQSENDTPMSDKTILTLVFIILFFTSFLWPIHLISDLKDLFKKEEAK